ncbi:DEAD/DEAH box helicase, partial [Bacillus pumilus]
MKKKTMNELIEELKKDEQVEHWHEIKAKPAQTSPVPERVNEKLKKALEKRGVSELYIHQKEAFERVMDAEHVVTVTPTASGKTLCYNLPVLQSIVEDQTSRSLYLFPTKALAQDQKSELNEIIHEMDVPIHSETYDGDTSPAIRQRVRQAGHIVITNPDMLHSAILPHHTKWVSLFENLKYIVIDELH